MSVIFEDIKNYLEDLDKDQTYPPDFSVFLSELNRRIQIPITYGPEGNLDQQTYTLSQLINLPNVGSEALKEGIKGQQVLPLELLVTITTNENLVALNNAENWYEYTQYLNAFITDISEEQQVDISGQSFSYVSPAIENINIAEVEKYVVDWSVADVGDTPFSENAPKVGNPGQIAPVAEITTDIDTGQTRFSSYKYYSGPNTPINQSDQYIDPNTGLLKRDAQGNPIKPIFRTGQASAMFQGLRQEAIFEIQQELADLGLDLGSFNFVPGVIDFSAKNNEIDFVAMLMTQANDLHSIAPNLNIIDENAVTVLGKLRPFLEYKKNIDESTNAYLEQIKTSFAGEIIPPTDAEVKAAVDTLFAERGLYATSNDYSKYATIFGNLKKQAAERELEIEENRISLGDVIGLSKPGATGQAGPFTYGGFGIVTPTAEEAREQLGKPLLQQIDVMSELGKVMDNLESGRIDASQEISARGLAAAQFKSNFMEFEEFF